MSPEQREQFQDAMRSIPGAQEEEARRIESRKRIVRLGEIEEALELQKSWHILHYLFTGHIDESAAPGSDLVTGQPLGEDVGYGPPRLHSASETREFDEFLQSQNLGRLQSRVDYREMTRLRVYSMPMGPGSDDEYNAMLRHEVGNYFPILRDYVHRMAAKGDGLLIWLSYQPAAPETARPLCA
jgi:hypothetical protein